MQYSKDPDILISNDTIRQVTNKKSMPLNNNNNNNNNNDNNIILTYVKKILDPPLLT